MAYTPVWALHHIGSDAGKMLIVELECEERHTEPLPQFGHVMQMLRSHGRHHLVSASPTALTRLHGSARSVGAAGGVAASWAFVGMWRGVSGSMTAWTAL